jgi:UDP-N-acetyl-D-mannosaminuronate dehydrogenase
MKKLVIGMGEVGKAVQQVYGGDGYDIQQSEIPPCHYDVLHLCYPDSGGQLFVNSARDYEHQFKPKLVIIHSTVQVGTTRKLGEKYVHSPVCGRHGSGGLVKGMQSFRRFVGGICPIGRLAAIQLLAVNERELGRPVNAGDPENTELAKLLDTTYLGWCVMFEKESARICEEQGADPYVVYSWWNAEYNDGYGRLGESRFIRPILDPMPGPIGGHCVIPNAHLLDSWLTKTIIERNETYKT